MDDKIIKNALSYALGADLHEAWRAPRKRADGTFEPYRCIIDNFKDDLEINSDLLDELINNNKIKLNADTYKRLIKSNINALVKLSINSIEDLLNIKEEIELDNYIVENILLSNIETTKKIQLFENIEIDQISKEALSKITKEIIKCNIYLNDQLVENIFKRLNQEDKTKYFVYLHKSNNSNIKYLYEIDEKISKIRNGISNKLSFKYSKSLKEFMEYLKEENIINKIEIKKDKIHIAYKKTKIEK